jgi:two-component system chemotaxis response regulator CheY
MMTMRKLVKKGLQSMGFSQFEEAENGQIAWEKLTQNPEIGLIISDLNMPHCTGLNFLKMVRTHDQFKNLPFLLLTAEGEFSQVKSALAAGVDNCVLKPFTSQSLKEKLSLTYQKKTA